METTEGGRFMQIAQHKHVTLEYVLKDDQGTILDSTESRNPFGYVHGTNSILPAIEEALEGKSAGNDVAIRIPSKEAYGERNESLVFTTAITNFGEADEIHPGTRVRVRTSEGEQILTITEIADERVTMDGNHPLAGVNLNFEISVVGVRDCSQDEIDEVTAVDNTNTENADGSPDVTSEDTPQGES
jgi:FKBP-type peptidyl-prolyl cis-trans isomerase SlyD